MSDTPLYELAGDPDVSIEEFYASAATRMREDARQILEQQGEKELGSYAYGQLQAIVAEQDDATCVGLYGAYHDSNR